MPTCCGRRNKPIILGPGSLEQAHSPDESVSFEQVLRPRKSITISSPRCATNSNLFPCEELN